MKQAIVIGPRGHIDSADHRRAINKAGGVPATAVVRFYFDEGTWVDVKFDEDYVPGNGKERLQVRAMSDRVPTLAVVPQSGNTILLVPGG